MTYEPRKAQVAPIDAGRSTAQRIQEYPGKDSFLYLSSLEPRLHSEFDPIKTASWVSATVVHSAEGKGPYDPAFLTAYRSAGNIGERSVPYGVKAYYLLFGRHGSVAFYGDRPGTCDEARMYHMGHTRSSAREKAQFGSLETFYAPAVSVQTASWAGWILVERAILMDNINLRPLVLVLGDVDNCQQTQGSYDVMYESMTVLRHHEA
ncbi:hypothetical protein OE88DRAFT_1645731 [Heliocybe sulcata]|uniref:Uncharacterized protein n=1 Tax=Heliocybe sulcata TaxID=5364 RepID=A0A5C3N1L8_9AGAM|nr:hypothetical protein OE88DRAFT_1645731 [Heliocybe sulcata]